MSSTDEKCTDQDNSPVHDSGNGNKQAVLQTEACEEKDKYQSLDTDSRIIGGAKILSISPWSYSKMESIK